jgi:ribose 1,5-bisphosphokinase PhnN
MAVMDACRSWTPSTNFFLSKEKIRTAPDDVLVKRLAGRRRMSDGSAKSRLDRAHDFQDTLDPEIVIRNTESAETGIRMLIDVINGRRVLSDFPAGYFL